MNKKIMIESGFAKQVENVELSKCASCEKIIHMNEFKDEISRREFKISGMCQKCQDGVFG